MSDLMVLIVLVLMLLCIAAGYWISLQVQRSRRNAAENSVRNLLTNARRQAEAILKEGKLHAKEELIRIRETVEASMAERRRELTTLEDRLAQREQTLDRRVEQIDRREEQLELKAQGLEATRKEAEQERANLDKLREDRLDALAKVAELSRENAKAELLSSLEAELTAEASALIRRMHQEAHLTAERDARKIIALAIERYSAEQVNEMTTCAVPLPGDEMKGRIIGKEGRNIRALEALTGVNILIDDTPEVVVVSGFDPLRREIARRSLEQLMADGRIHPSRIEEVVTKVQSDIDQLIDTAGQQAVVALDLPQVAPEVVKMLGRLKFRHSYGQNVLKHSIEMGRLMGMMAAELSLDPALARRIGLLHDIGKAMDHDLEGSHALIGADFIKRHGETPLICNAVAAHHNEVEAESIYAILARAGDTMTAARPGARTETTEIYLKRLEKLEQIANSFRGVEKCFAVHAGREVRVFVEPSHISDDEAVQLARNISKQIELDLQYPGQIKVTVLRETRFVEYAR